MQQRRKRAGITLKIVYDHLQHQHQDILRHIHGMEHSIHGVKLGIDSLGSEVHSLRKDLGDLRRDFRGHCKGTDDLDFRVQDIEEADLPGRVRRIEKHLGLSAR